MLSICRFSRMLRVFGLFAIGLLLFDVVCLILSLALDYWVYFDNDNLHINAGIWTACTEVKTNSTKTCKDVEADGSLNTVRATLILSLVLICAAIVCIVLKLFVKKETKILVYITAGMLLLAGIFLIVGFAVFRSQTFSSMKDAYHSYLSLHAGFAFCVIGWLFTWTAAGLTMLMFFVEDLE